MNLNIHPIFVHFPIALLTLYALGELVYFKKVRELPYVFYCKAIAVIVGTLSAFVTLQTGEWAERAYRNSSATMRIIEIHSTWADGAVIVFGVLAAAYAIAWLNRTTYWNQLLQKQSWLQSTWKVLSVLSRVCIQTPLVLALSLAGLIAITVTGALGGSLVYGPDIDPVVSFIYHLLIK